MIEFLNKIAEERFSTQEERDAFLEGFHKEASLGLAGGAGNLAGYVSSALQNPNIGRPLGALAVGLLGVGLAKGITSTSSGVSTLVLRTKFSTALSQVMSSNKIVRNADPEKVKSYAETIFKFAPHVAADANLLAFTLANIVQGESGIDMATIKSLTDLEGRYQDNTSSSPLMGIKV